MSQENPFENKLGEFTQVDRSTPEKREGVFDDREVNEIISRIEKDYPDVAGVLKSLSNKEREDMDKDFNSLGEMWGLFNLLDESNQEQVTQILKSFKELEQDNKYSVLEKVDQEALVKRKAIVKELVNILS